MPIRLPTTNVTAAAAPPAKTIRRAPRMALLLVIHDSVAPTESRATALNIALIITVLVFAPKMYGIIF